MRSRYWILSCVIVFAVGKPFEAWACSTADFQSCKSCTELEKAIDLSKPDAGDYYRGAEWNGLYSAYVLNCPLVAGKLLKAGANPSSGGSSGSMILTISSKWPHDSRKVNESFAALLLAAGADADKRLNWREGMTTRGVLAEESWFTPDYADLLALFMN